MLNRFVGDDTIVALSSPPGMGAIALVRLSGKEALSILKKVFTHKEPLDSHKAVFGRIKNGNQVIDEVVVTTFQDGKSFTGEDTVEISCHGSTYIQQQILELLLNSGARMAEPGEFTMRAFMNGKMDLSQAEAVADLIHSTSAKSHEIAMQQMRGGFSNDIKDLRQQLINFASLIELELDFATEDVEFADRDEFKALINKIQSTLRHLIDSFKLGNVIKNGVPVAIVGEPNVGKSTLLNALLNEERAIVSDIAGTTRDTIEDELNINGITFRFIDTAGIRNTEDTIEKIGIEKAWEKVGQAQIVLRILDSTIASNKDIESFDNELKNRFNNQIIKVLYIFNKSDLTSQTIIQSDSVESHTNYELGIMNYELLRISAKQKFNIDQLKNKLFELVNLGEINTQNSIVTNSRHYDALTRAEGSMNAVISAMQNGIPSDLLAIDIREALAHLGEITGEITTDDLLGNIFQNFCIGK